MPNPRGNPQNLNKGGTPEMMAKSIEVRRAKALEKKEKYLTYISRGITPSAAAEASGLKYSYIYNLRSNDPEFKAAEKRAEAVASEPVESALKQAALDGNVPAAVKWLEKRSPDRWADAPKESNLTVEFKADDVVAKIMSLLGRVKELPEAEVIDVD